ncbi:NAD(P)-binding protein [Amniculicola lignicola CBS 123094]|uniref:NAD(P)-binding protein n=1 Tax=Amniculicola lignicola CBS 123094 TaxID=1392246 RepID=A0A6A5WSI4_9PLEO|nr:NAD(P)-binding protein [Amniculicola lignicola CBS 123094]
MGAALSQAFPPTAALTPANLPSLKHKTYAITGGTSGVGLALAQLLYNAGATVYITARSTESLACTLKTVLDQGPTDGTAGSIDGVIFDLADLVAVKRGGQELLKMAARIDVLFLNAGVSQPPLGSKTVQGYELHMGVNCLGHFLLAHILLPGLITSAQKSKTADPSTAPGSTRIIWTASQMIDLHAPTGGFPRSFLSSPPMSTTAGQILNYTNSKLGNYYLAVYFAALPQVQQHDILSLAMNPGNLRTNMMRHQPFASYMTWPFMYPAVYGAYTALWTGLSEELGMQDQGGYVVPWGRRHPGMRPDLLEAIHKGKAEEFGMWCEEQIKQYLV